MKKRPTIISCICPCGSGPGPPQGHLYIEYICAISDVLFINIISKRMTIHSIIRSLCCSLIGGLALSLTSMVALAQEQMPAPPPLPMDTALRMGQLDNGLTYFIRRNALPEGRAHFYISQRVGSMQEEESQRGLAHFLEHMAFNGTKHFPGKTMINWLETIGVRFGSNLNAYTGFDETVYNIMNAPVARQTVIDSCVLILRDWSHGISLEEKEIDAERGVIHEEWRSRDNGDMRIYTELFRRAFPGHRYGERMPIGLMDVVRGFKYQELRDYYKRWYRPDLQAVIVVGDIDVDYVEQAIRRTFADVPRPEGAAERTYPPVADHEGILSVVVTDPEASGTSVAISFKTDAMPQAMRASQLGIVEDYIKAVAVAMANERFSDIVKKPNAPFLSASLSLGEFLIARNKDEISFSAVATDGQYKRALEALTMEMERIRQYGFTEGEYRRAVSDLMVGIKAKYNERNKRLNGEFAEEYSNYFVKGGYLTDIDTYYQTMQQFSSVIPVSAINQMMQQTMGKDNILLVLSAPARAEYTYPTEGELAAEFEAARSLPVEPYRDAVSDQKLMTTTPRPGKVRKVQTEQPLETTVWTLSNGVKVILKPTKHQDDEILVYGRRPGGSLLYAEQYPLEARSLNEVINLGGLADFDDSALSKVLAGRMASVKPAFDDAAETISGSTTVEDLETMMQLLYLNFTAKRSDREAFAAYQEQAKGAIKMARNNPMTPLIDSVRMAIQPSSPFSRPLTEADVDALDYDRIMSIYRERYGDASGFQFVFVGNIDPAVLRPLVETYIATLPVKRGAKHSIPLDKFYPLRPGVYVNHFAQRQETPMGVVFDFYSGQFESTQRNGMTIQILGEVLNQIYIETLREAEGGTYGASVEGGLSVEPAGRATLQVVFQTDPAKADQLNAIVYSEMDKIEREGIPADKFDKVITNMEKEFAERIKRNSYWQNVVSTYYYRHRDSYTDYLSTLRSIKPTDVQQMLRDLRAQGNRIEVIMRAAQ